MYENSEFAEEGSARSVKRSDVYGLSSSDSLRKTGSYYELAKYKSGSGNYCSYYISADGTEQNGYPWVTKGVRPVVVLKSGVKAVKANASHTTHTTPETAWNLQ